MDTIQVYVYICIYACLPVCAHIYIYKFINLLKAIIGWYKKGQSVLGSVYSVKNLHKIVVYPMDISDI